jgi:hypothetical protein
LAYESIGCVNDQSALKIKQSPVLAHTILLEGTGMSKDLGGPRQAAWIRRKEQRCGLYGGRLSPHAANERHLLCTHVSGVQAAQRSNIETQDRPRRCRGVALALFSFYSPKQSDSCLAIPPSDPARSFGKHNWQGSFHTFTVFADILAPHSMPVADIQQENSIVVRQQRVVDAEA